MLILVVNQLFWTVCLLIAWSLLALAMRSCFGCLHTIVIYSIHGTLQCAHQIEVCKNEMYCITCVCLWLFRRMLHSLLFIIPLAHQPNIYGDPFSAIHLSSTLVLRPKFKYTLQLGQRLFFYFVILINRIRLSLRIRLPFFQVVSNSLQSNCVQTLIECTELKMSPRFMRVNEPNPFEDYPSLRTKKPKVFFKSLKIDSQCPTIHSVK